MKVKQSVADILHYRKFFVLCFIALFLLVFSVIWIRSVPVEAQQEISPTAIILSENFDGAVEPNLPTGWTTSAIGVCEPFVTTSEHSYTMPNAAFVPVVNGAGISELVSPTFTLGNSASQPKLIFRHAIKTDNWKDGGVLEIKIGAGAWQDILAAGGSFASGGYDSLPFYNTQNPLAGRRGWTGWSGPTTPPTFINTEVNFPAQAFNQSIQLRWRFGTDETEFPDTNIGWYLDNIQIIDNALQSKKRFLENFDSALLPSLPVGWTQTSSGSTPYWATYANGFADSAPNAARIYSGLPAGDASLISPPIMLNANSAILTFRHRPYLQIYDDGGVLEIKIGDGNWEDILSAGGVFIAGPYNSAVDANSTNPLAGRSVWSYFLTEYMTTQVQMPSAALHRSFQLRWRFGQRNYYSYYWFVDSIKIETPITGDFAAQISIPASGTAEPYPAEIQVSGLPGLVTGISVNLEQFSHSSPDDVDLMLVAPNGRKVILMSDVGGTNAVNNLTLTFDDTAVQSLPDNTPLASGNYKPTNFEPNDIFPAPAPQGAPQVNSLAAFKGIQPNGAWQLFLVDDNGNNVGNIAGGWNILLQSSVDALGIPSVGTANPYPSEKIISGLQGTVRRATVKIENFNHSAPDDADILLVAPNGRKVVLMSDAGGTTPANNLTLTFTDDAQSFLPDNAPLESGRYKPSNFESNDVFPAPAPAGASAAKLNTFFGIQPNGVWKLFVVDDTTGENFGSIDNWQLTLETSTVCSVFLADSLRTFAATGGNNSFNFNAPENCNWTVSTNDSFVQITSPTSGTGDAVINFNLAQNIGNERVGTIAVTVGEVVRTFLIDQVSGCAALVNNTTQNFPAAGGAGLIQVTAASSCVWRTVTDADWINITNAPQSGNRTLNFSVQPNPLQTARSATIFIGLSSVTISQAGSVSRRFDFDGDGKADISVFRPSNSHWYILNSRTNSMTATQFGISTDKIIPADYDGDRKTDIAVFRNGIWYLLKSQTSTVDVLSWGTSADTPLAADYDGDGRADLAVFRPAEGNWYILRSSNGSYQISNFGLAADKPLSGDFDGDGRADLAVYRFGAQSQWFVLNSQNASITSRQFGIEGDVPVAADYDGDGRDNFAVFRPSSATWHFSETNFDSRQWGISGDTPVPADYTGDGRTDLGVFRQGVWYILDLSTEAVRIESWGLSDDKPIPDQNTSQ